MMTSAPSMPPSARVLGDASSRSSRSGSFSIRSRNCSSHAVLLKPRALAVHLVRQAAGGDDRDLQILGIALDRACAAPGRACSSAAPTGSGNCSTPICSGTIGAGQSGSCGSIIDSGEKQPWSSGLSWKNDMSNSSATSAGADVMRRAPACPCTGGSVARAAALVGDRVRLADAERERRVVVEEERRDVIVVDDDSSTSGFFSASHCWIGS